MTDHELDQATLTTVLDSWAGSEVAVRIVSEKDDLITVSGGRLGGREPTKGPALFWPPEGQLDTTKSSPVSGFIQSVSSPARLHTGGFAVELHQGGVELNVRRLH